MLELIYLPRVASRGISSLDKIDDGWRHEKSLVFGHAPRLQDVFIHGGDITICNRKSLSRA